MKTLNNKFCHQFFHVCYKKLMIQYDPIPVILEVSSGVICNKTRVLLILFSLFFVKTVGAEITKSAAETKLNYQFRNLAVEVMQDQEVIIPAKIFKIWYALANNLDFEVGGGIDFNFAKQVERIKISYGEEKTVAFLPDFEIAWHTHPSGKQAGKAASLRPPSAEDIILAIAGNYNLWLITTGRIAKDYSNALILRAYSEQLERLYVVELNLVADPAGVYVYRANNKYWLNIWQDKQLFQAKLLALKDNLQKNIDKYVIFVAENKLTVNEARDKLLAFMEDEANITIKFLPWQQVLQDGLQVKLDIVEFLQHKRKR